MTESLSVRNPSHWVWRNWSEVTRARVTFVIVAGVLLGLYEDPFATGVLTRAIDSYLRLYAGAAGAVLHVIDPALLVSRDTIRGPRAAIQIVRGCDAAEMMILYAAAVVATHEGSWSRRAVGVAGGWAALVAANVGRLCCMYYLIAYAPSWQAAFHYEVFPLILVLVALGLYVAWRRGFAVPTAPPAAGVAS